MATKKTSDTKKPGTAVAVKATNTNVVAIREALAKQAAAMAERTAPPGGSKIKMPQGGGKFILPDGREVEGSIEAIIVDFRAVHSFWPGKFDKKDIKPPVCFAVGLNPRQMAPTDNSPDKQAESCQSCPNNQFGSDGDGKACKNMRRLAILPPLDSDEVTADVEHDMWVLDVSPTAIKNFDGFVQTIARTFQTPPCGVVVTIGFDSSVDYGKLVFSNPRPITNVADVMAKQDEAGVMLDAEPDFSQLNAANDAKAARPAAKKVANARR
jgi:hypothetical protein